MQSFCKEISAHEHNWTMQNVAHRPNFSYLMPHRFKRKLKIKAALPEASCGVWSLLYRILFLVDDSILEKCKTSVLQATNSHVCMLIGSHLDLFSCITGSCYLFSRRAVLLLPLLPIGYKNEGTAEMKGHPLRVKDTEDRHWEWWALFKQSEHPASFLHTATRAHSSPLY